MTKPCDEYAFPAADCGHGAPYAGGMTLRDYFAAKAMSGWLASFGPDDAVTVKRIAEFAYEVADAMLLERVK